MNLKEARVQAQQSMSGVTNKSLCTFINNFVKNVVHNFDSDESQRSMSGVTTTQQLYDRKHTCGSAPLSSSGNTNKRFPIMFSLLHCVACGQSHKCSEI